MKKITTLLVLMILLISHSLPAQTKDTLLLKSKHQQTAAWIMVGGGTTLLVVGTIVGAHSFFNLFSGQFDKANNNLGAAAILDITGSVAILGSIPFFIAASKNKHKAMKLTFINQPMPALVKDIMGYKPVPSLSLQFNL